MPQVNGRSQRAIGHAPVESGRIQRERESHQPSAIRHQHPPCKSYFVPCAANLQKSLALSCLLLGNWCAVEVNMAQRGNPEVGELLKKSTCWQKQQSANWTVGDIHGAMHVPCIDLVVHHGKSVLFLSLYHHFLVII